MAVNYSKWVGVKLEQEKARTLRDGGKLSCLTKANQRTESRRDVHLLRLLILESIWSLRGHSLHYQSANCERKTRLKRINELHSLRSKWLRQRFKNAWHQQDSFLKICYNSQASQSLWALLFGEAATTNWLSYLSKQPLIRSTTGAVVEMLDGRTSVLLYQFKRRQGREEKEEDWARQVARRKERSKGKFVHKTPTSLWPLPTVEHRHWRNDGGGETPEGVFFRRDDDNRDKSKRTNQ